MNRDAFILSTMNVGQFRQFRKALATLLRAGFDRDSAVALLTEAHDKRTAWNLSTKRSA
jgi:hypothetical protein